MRISYYVLALALALLVESGPLVGNCTGLETERCFSGMNICNEPFSTCWMPQCTNGMAVDPVVTAPACHTTPSLTITDPAVVVTTTPTPPATTTGPCWPLTVCMDGVMSCGNETLGWSGCYNICETNGPKRPVCTEAPMNITRAPATMTMTKTKSKSKAPRPPCNKDKAWMCAPADW